MSQMTNKFYKSKMSNEFKDKDIKSHWYYFFDVINNIKNFDSNKIKTDPKSYKSILIYCIGYVTIKNLKYVKIKSVNPLYLIVSKVNGLVPLMKAEKKFKKHKELWSKIRDLITSITKK